MKKSAKSTIIIILSATFHTNKKGVLDNLILVNTYIFWSIRKNIDSNGIFL